MAIFKSAQVPNNKIPQATLSGGEKEKRPNVYFYNALVFCFFLESIFWLTFLFVSDRLLGVHSRGTRPPAEQKSPTTNNKLKQTKKKSLNSPESISGQNGANINTSPANLHMNTCNNNNSHALTRPAENNSLVSSSPRCTQKNQVPTCKCPLKNWEGGGGPKMLSSTPEALKNSWQQRPKGTFFSSRKFPPMAAFPSRRWRHFSGKIGNQKFLSEKQRQNVTKLFQFLCDRNVDVFFRLTERENREKFRRAEMWQRGGWRHVTRFGGKKKRAKAVDAKGWTNEKGAKSWRHVICRREGGHRSICCKSALAQDVGGCCRVLIDL